MKRWIILLLFVLPFQLFGQWDGAAWDGITNLAAEEFSDPIPEMTPDAFWSARLDGDNISWIVGGNVDSLQDYSGNGYHGELPTPDSLIFVNSFQGRNKYAWWKKESNRPYSMYLDTLYTKDDVSEFSLFIVVSPVGDVTSTSHPICGFSRHGYAYTQLAYAGPFIIGSGEDNKLGYFTWDEDSATITTSGSISDFYPDSVYVIILTADANDSTRLWVNGNFMGGTYIGGGDGGFINTSNGNRYGIIGPSGTTFSFEGYMAEHAIWRRKLSQFEVDKINNEFLDYYGIS